MKLMKKVFAVLAVSLAVVGAVGCGKKHEHEFSDWVITENATCTENGEQSRTCQCGEVETEEILAKGHTEGKWILDKTGHTKKCSVCETVISQGEHISGGQATEEQEEVCSVCGYTLAPKIHEHTYGVDGKCTFTHCESDVSTDIGYEACKESGWSFTLPVVDGKVYMNFEAVCSYGVSFSTQVVTGASEENNYFKSLKVCEAETKTDIVNGNFEKRVSYAVEGADDYVICSDEKTEIGKTYYIEIELENYTEDTIVIFPEVPNEHYYNNYGTCTQCEAENENKYDFTSGTWNETEGRWEYVFETETELEDFEEYYFTVNLEKGTYFVKAEYEGEGGEVYSNYVLSATNCKRFDTPIALEKGKHNFSVGSGDKKITLKKVCLFSVGEVVISETVATDGIRQDMESKLGEGVGVEVFDGYTYEDTAKHLTYTVESIYRKETGNPVLSVSADDIANRYFSAGATYGVKLTVTAGKGYKTGEDLLFDYFTVIGVTPVVEWEVKVPEARHEETEGGFCKVCHIDMETVSAVLTNGQRTAPWTYEQSERKYFKILVTCDHKFNTCANEISQPKYEVYNSDGEKISGKINAKKGETYYQVLSNTDTKQRSAVAGFFAEHDLDFYGNCTACGEFMGATIPMDSVRKTEFSTQDKKFAYSYKLTVTDETTGRYEVSVTENGGNNLYGGLSVKVVYLKDGKYEEMRASVSSTETAVKVEFTKIEGVSEYYIALEENDTFKNDNTANEYLCIAVRKVVE